MPQKIIVPLEVDQVTITAVMDNNIDVLMADTEAARRFSLGSHPFERNQPMAEHL